MAKPHGSVRIGPISLFTLIIILCLAVLAVLSVTTARAELSVTERQAQTTTETYQLETVAQTFVADVDTALSQGDAAALDTVLAAYGVAVSAPAPDTAGASGGEAIPDETPAGEAIEDDTLSGAATSEASGGGTAVIECPAADPVTASGSFDGSLISAAFSMESGRTLDVALRVNDDGTYRIEQWKMTTQWTDDGTGANLWLG